MNEFSELPQHTQNLWFCILAHVQTEPQTFNTMPVTAAWKTVGYLGAYLWRQHGLCPPEPRVRHAGGSGVHPPSDVLLVTLTWKGCNSGKSLAGRHQVPSFQTKTSCEGAVTRRCDIGGGRHTSQWDRAESRNRPCCF